VFSSTSAGVRQIFDIFDAQVLHDQIKRLEKSLASPEEIKDTAKSTAAERIAQAKLNLAALKIQNAYIQSGGPELGYSSPEQRRHSVTLINKLEKELLKLTKGTEPHKRKAKELNDAENALKVLIDKDAEIDADLAPTHSTTPFGESDPKSSSVFAPTPSKFTFNRNDGFALFRSGSDFLETGQGEEAFDADLQRLLDDPAFADKVLTELRAFAAQEISNAEKAHQEAIADGDTDFGIEDAENINEDSGTDTAAAVAVLEKLLASRTGPASTTSTPASAEDNESFESIDLGETGEEGVESNEEIRARLEGVQENESERTADNVTAETENFIESNVDNF
jgi:hypothetical protein